MPIASCPVRRKRLPLLTLLFAACASGGASEASRGSFMRSVGTATQVDALEKARKVLGLFQYELRRQDTIPAVMIETEWRGRSPFADEVDLGIQAAENRVFVTARRRAETQLGPIYNVTMQIENRVRMDAGGMQWVETSATPMFQQYSDSIFKLYQRELTIGVRRYD
jgi:hypothetical protein